MNRVFQHTENLVVKEIGDEKVLIPLRSNVADMEQIYTLNETAAFIWEQMDGKTNLGQIIRNLVEEYDVDAETARLDVEDFISEMREFLILK